MPSFELHVNGGTQTVSVRDPDEPLLYVLRNRLGLTGAKYGCGSASAARARSSIDGEAQRFVPASREQGGGPRDHDDRGSRHAREAASAADGVHRRAGRAVRLLRRRHGDDGRGAARAESRRVTQDEAKDALAGNLCRCGTHQRILQAVLRATRKDDA